MKASNSVEASEKQLTNNEMRQVKFTYENGTETLHNAESISTITIARLVGQSVAFCDNVYDEQKRKYARKEASLRIVKAEIN